MSKKKPYILQKVKCNFKVRVWNYKGWASNPTPKSDTARVSSNVFTALGFLRASIVTMFNVMAVKSQKALKTQLVMNKTCVMALNYWINDWEELCYCTNTFLVEFYGLPSPWKITFSFRFVHSPVSQWRAGRLFIFGMFFWNAFLAALKIIVQYPENTENWWIKRASVPTKLWITFYKAAFLALSVG